MKNNRRELKWYETWIAESLASLLFGSVVTFLAWLLQINNFGPQGGWFILATFLGSTLGGLIVVIRIRVQTIEIDARERNRELATGAEVDNLLMQLQARLREVQANRSDVFNTYCKQELEGFLMRVARAAQQGELIVNEHHFGTIEDVLMAFGTGKNRVYRGVWSIENGEPLFDMAWQQYMTELIGLTELRSKTKRITVQLLLVIDKPQTLQRTAVQIVVGYLRSRRGKGITYRIISKDTYDEFVRDSRLNPRYIDFGVYGDELLYRTQSYEPKLGMFTEDLGTIRTYRQTHEAAMRSARALPDPTGAEGHDQLEKFLHADEFEEEARGKQRAGTISGRLVKIVTKDDHELDGILYEADDSIATVLHVHGSLGNFYHQPFIPVFAQSLTQEGINLLSCNMRTHDGIAEGYDTEGEMKYVGGSLVRFETCVEDIRAAVSWCRKFGRNVYLQGHSLGCDRVLHYLETTNAGLSPILLSPCDSHQLQKDWLGEDEFRRQEAALRERMENPGPLDQNAWTLAPQGAYGLRGEDGWTYEIPVTEDVLGSILLGAVGQLFAIEKGGGVVSGANALAYLGRSDPIRGASMEAMKSHLKVLLPNVGIVEGIGGHNMEECEKETAMRIADWIKEQEHGDQGVET